MDKRPSSKRYPAELKKRAVRMVRELQAADPGDQGVISRVARQLGVGKESLRAWVKESLSIVVDRKSHSGGDGPVLDVGVRCSGRRVAPLL